MTSSTASLDEAAETTLYKLLETRLASTTLVSIGHRAGLSAFHDRRLVVVRDADGYRLRDQTLAPAAG